MSELEIPKIEVLKEADLESTPAFYEDLTNNPVKTLLRDADVYNRVVRLVKFFDHTVTVGPRIFVNPPGIFIANIETVTGTHNIKEGKIFGIAYTPLITTLVGLRPLKYNNTTYSIDVGNFNTESKTISFRIYFYEILRKKKR